MHVVKILGWGIENGVPYWLAANSWNTDWGDKGWSELFFCDFSEFDLSSNFPAGYFKIRRGTNECRIEIYIDAALPKIS